METGPAGDPLTPRYYRRAIVAMVSSYLPLHFTSPVLLKGLLKTEGRAGGVGWRGGWGHKQAGSCSPEPLLLPRAPPCLLHAAPLLQGRGLRLGTGAGTAVQPPGSQAVVSEW